MNINTINKMNKLAHRKKEIESIKSRLYGLGVPNETKVTIHNISQHGSITTSIDTQLVKDLLFMQLNNDQAEYLDLLNNLTKEELSHEIIKETKNIRNTISDLF